MAIRNAATTSNKPIRMTDADWEEWMGDPQLARKEMAEQAERQRQLDDMLPELTKQYPDQWAALTESGELLIAPSLEALAEKFRALDTPPGSNVIEFLDTDPTPWIL
ncbi:MAG: hypothetical protein OXI54_12160 [Chloroflexota bacterium]|nr:hypothetical protein [Chloroflexota bacterium]MDE2684886.1 hypothetical protein [Chloroflexota bacterium]